MGGAVGTLLDGKRRDRQKREAMQNRVRRQSSLVSLREQQSIGAMEVQRKRCETLMKTFESICNDPQEVCMFKAFLHTEYGLTLWNLYEAVHCFEMSRCSDSASSERMMAYAWSFYQQYLSPEAEDFVEQIPSFLAVKISESLYRDELPDCSALLKKIKLELCDEGLMQRFASWLQTEEAQKEALKLERRQSASGSSSTAASLQPRKPTLLHQSSLSVDKNHAIKDTLSDIAEIDEITTTEKTPTTKRNRTSSFSSSISSSSALSNESPYRAGRQRTKDNTHRSEGTRSTPITPIPRSRKSATSFGLTSILLDQWEKDHEEGCDTLFADPQILTTLKDGMESPASSRYQNSNSSFQ